jgi:hypothetical protein
MRPGREHKMFKTVKNILSSISGEGGSCSSEIKYDRRMAPSLKLFVSAKILQKQRPRHRKAVLGISSGKDVFYSSETKNDRRMALREILLFSARGLQERGYKPENYPELPICIVMTIDMTSRNDTHCRDADKYTVFSIDKLGDNTGHDYKKSTLSVPTSIVATLTSTPYLA